MRSTVPWQGGALQAGKDSTTLVFTVPNLPPVSDLRISVTTLYIEGGTVINVLRWDLPHLAWDTSTGFNQIDRIHITTASRSWDIEGNKTEFRQTSRIENSEGGMRRHLHDPIAIRNLLQQQRVGGRNPLLTM